MDAGMIRTEPQQRCLVCGDVEIVRPDGRGFPPDIAKRRLIKRCRESGHTCQPKYTAGFTLPSAPHWMEGMKNER